MKFTCTVFPIALIGLLFAGCSPVVETDTVKKSDNQQWHFELQKAPPPFEGAVGHDAGIKFISNGGDVVVLPIVIPTSEQDKQISDLVKKVLAAKSADPDADTSALETKIDNLVNQLYGMGDKVRCI